MTEQSPEIIVRCEGLTKEYDELTALAELNLSIPRGHVFGYIGHNGAGKTTTIRILAGLLTASRGRASIAGLDVAAHRDRIKRLVGYMPDQFGVYDQMRVWEYLDFFGAAFKIRRKARRERIEHVLEITDAGYMRDRFVDTLSRGMKQRVGIARTLMHDPQVLLLDEPASGLDPKARIHMRQLLRRLADDGKTLLVSSHILPELAAICDSVGIVDHGRLIASGPLARVLGELQRDRLMEIKLLGGGPSVQAAVDAIERNEQAGQLDQANAPTGILRFRYSGDDAQLAELLGRFVSAGAKVVTLREVPLSLEDAYMALSGVGSQIGGTEEPDAAGDREGDA